MRQRGKNWESEDYSGKISSSLLFEPKEIPRNYASHLMKDSLLETMNDDETAAD